MSKSNNKNTRTGISNNANIIPISKTWQDKLPYIKDIRASWIANISHCDKNSPSKRDKFVKNNIKMCEEWSGEVGFLKYYLFHYDNNYIPGKSQLERINDKKGFNPDNCRIIDKPIKKPTKKKETKEKDIIEENNINTIQEVKIHETSVNVINNMFLTMTEENRTEIAKALLMALGVNYTLIEGRKEVMLFVDNKSNLKMEKAR